MNIPIDIAIDELVVAPDASKEMIRKVILNALTQQWAAQHPAGRVAPAMDTHQLLIQAADRVATETRAHLQ